MTTNGFSLDGLLYIHAAMRRDTVRLARRAAANPTPAEVAAIAAWFARFKHQLDEHHHAEDDLFFPMLTARDPSLAAAFAPLEEDHVAMVALLAQVSACLGRGAGPELTAATAALASLMDDHLGREEDIAVPATARLLSAADQRAFEDGLRRRASLSELGFAMPWILSAVPADRAGAMLSGLPLPLRLLLRVLWRGRYERLSSVLDAPSLTLPSVARAEAR